jgi:hypothetical protein
MPGPIVLKENPTLQTIFRKALPSYKKHTIYIHISQSIELWGTWWDGGSRDEYCAINSKGDHLPFTYSQDPPEFRTGDKKIPTIKLGNGVAVIRHGISCGKPATAGLYVAPEDLAKFLDITPKA